MISVLFRFRRIEIIVFVQAIGLIVQAIGVFVQVMGLVVQPMG
jgi:hypothetical protein